MTDEDSAATGSGRGRKRKQNKARGGGTGGGNAGGGPKAPRVVVRPLAPPARRRPRHWGLALSFLLLVVAPVSAAWWYLTTRAVDQYASTMGFTVRSEEVASATDILGGLGAAFGSTGGQSDSDILYEFVQSQEIVAGIDGQLDLRGLYSRHFDTDPLLSFDPDGTIEDLTDYWDRMVHIAYDTGTGLIEIETRAFDAEEARTIALAIRDAAGARINTLSEQAREDAIRFAQEDLDLALDRLKAAREALTSFRLANRIVDPAADIAGQVGLLNTLQAQLAEALIDFDLLSGSTGQGDPRLEQAQRRITVIEARIDDERAKFGTGGSAPGGASYADTVATFESLTVDREFAERSYLAALSAFDAARAEADRASRYLATYIEPTLAQKSEYPQVPLLIGLVALFGFLAWAVLGLVYYSLRDSR